MTPNLWYLTRGRGDGEPSPAWVMGLAQLCGFEGDCVELGTPPEARTVIGHFNNEEANPD